MRSATHNTGGRGREPGILQSLLCTTTGRSVSGRNHAGLLPTPSQQHLKTQRTFAVIYAAYRNERVYLQNRKKYQFFIIIQLSYKVPSEVRLIKCRKRGHDSRQAQEEKLPAPSPVLPDWVPDPSKVQSVWELWEHTPL